MESGHRADPRFWGRGNPTRTGTSPTNELGHREADNRDDAVGLLLVAEIPRLGGGDALPGGVAFRAEELGCRDIDRLAADLDLSLVGVGREVVVPGRVCERAAG